MNKQNYKKNQIATVKGKAETKSDSNPRPVFHTVSLKQIRRLPEVLEDLFTGVCLPGYNRY